MGGDGVAYDGVDPEAPGDVAAAITPETVPERAIIAEWGGQVALTGDAKNHSSTEQLAKLKR